MVPLESPPNGAYLGVRGGLRLNCCAWGQAIVYIRMGKSEYAPVRCHMSKSWDLWHSSLFLYYKITKQERTISVKRYFYESKKLEFFETKEVDKSTQTYERVTEGRKTFSTYTICSCKRKSCVAQMKWGHCLQVLILLALLVQKYSTMSEAKRRMMMEQAGWERDENFPPALLL